MDLDILALIATIAFVLIALFLIPVLIQIRQTARRVDEFVEVTQRDMLPLMKDMREVTEHLKMMTVEAEEDLTRLRPLFESMEQTGEALHTVTSALNSGVGRVVAQSVGTWWGARAAKKAIYREMSQTKKRR